MKYPAGAHSPSRPSPAACQNMCHVRGAENVSRGAGAARRQCPASTRSNDWQAGGFREKYALGFAVGAGAFSTVHRAEHRETGQACAVKIVNKRTMEPDQLAPLDREVRIMEALHHPHIIELIEWYDEESARFLVMEMCPGGNLFDRIVARTAFSEAGARRLLRPLVAAVDYIHKRGIVHRDLKPENVLLLDEEEDDDDDDPPFDGDAGIKVADFGFAERVDALDRDRVCGTPHYVAPEVISGTAYGAKVDVWSIGVIAFACMGGYLPFRGDGNLSLLFRKIVAGDVRFHAAFWSHTSSLARHFIRQALRVDPCERPSAAQLLQHPWLLRQGSESK